MTSVVFWFVGLSEGGLSHGANMEVVSNFFPKLVPPFIGSNRQDFTSRTGVLKPCALFPKNGA